MKHKLIRFGLPVAIMFSPLIASAQGATIGSILLTLQDLLNLLVPILITAALLYFIWGFAKYIGSHGEKVEVEKGRDMMIWGVLSMFAIVAIWGLVAIVGRTFGIDQNSRLRGNQVPLVESPFTNSN